MKENSEHIVQRLWNLCHILRGDGISYHEYISELTYLLFLKIAEENGSEELLPKGNRWHDLVNYRGDNLLFFYQQMLTNLGGSASSKVVRDIYAFPTTVFSHSENLRAVIDGIAKVEWHSVEDDGIGDIYEGLLAKNSEDARSGAGQYFTPRPLVDCIVNLSRPRLGETIQDPAAGSGGFLISTDQYLRSSCVDNSYAKNPPNYEGVEIERNTHRICLMNVFLHQMDANIIFGDALTEDSNSLAPADLILANPPFGAKGGSARKARKDLLFPTKNKQLAFLQHVMLGLKRGGRAAVVMPDNVLFEEGVGREIRIELMDQCDLHTILRLPTGIFYSQGVKTNVLFFNRAVGGRDNTNSVLVYDLRTKMRPFGKRNPLTREFFRPFERTYGERNTKETEHKSEAKESRFRWYSREEIKDRDENLDICWLNGDTSSGDRELNSPAEIAAEILEKLRITVSETENLLDIVQEENDDPKGRQ